MLFFQYAEVVYVGYGNKETVWAKDLLPSTGVAAVQADQPADTVKDQPANPQAETKKPVQEKPPVQVEARPQAEAVAALHVKIDPVPVKAEALPVKIVPVPVDAAPAKVDAVPAKELGAKPVSDPASSGAQASKWLKGKSTHSSMSDVSQVGRKLIVALKGCEMCEYVC